MSERQRNTRSGRYIDVVCVDGEYHAVQMEQRFNHLGALEPSQPHRGSAAVLGRTAVRSLTAGRPRSAEPLADLEHEPPDAPRERRPYPTASRARRTFAARRSEQMLIAALLLCAFVMGYMQRGDTASAPEERTLQGSDAPAPEAPTSIAAIPAPPLAEAQLPPPTAEPEYAPVTEQVVTDETPPLVEAAITTAEEDGADSFESTAPGGFADALNAQVSEEAEVTQEFPEDDD